MSQPVKLSDELVCDARMTSELSRRSIAGQIEFWARLGQSLEPLLRGDRVAALLKSTAAQPLSDAIASVDTAAGRSRVADYLETRPYPHYQVAEGQPGYLTRIDEDGTETIGRFENRQFVPRG